MLKVCSPYTSALSKVVEDSISCLVLVFFIFMYLCYHQCAVLPARTPKPESRPCAKFGWWCISACSDKSKQALETISTCHEFVCVSVYDFFCLVCVSVFVLNIHHSRIDMKHWDPFCLCECVREIFFVKLTPLFTSFSRVQKSLCLCLCVCFRCHSSALFSFSSWLFVCIFER